VPVANVRNGWKADRSDATMSDEGEIECL